MRETIAKVRRYQNRQRAEVLQAYGGACACCGYDDVRALALDHVNGDGSRERLAKIYSYRKAKADGFPENYQLLCHNCNFLKGRKDECPCGNKLTLALLQENIPGLRTGDRGPRGEEHGKAKLSDQSVKEIKIAARMHQTYEEIARKYGVGKSTIASVVTGKTWKHVTD